MQRNDLAALAPEAAAGTEELPRQARLLLAAAGLATAAPLRGEPDGASAAGLDDPGEPAQADREPQQERATSAESAGSLDADSGPGRPEEVTTVPIVLAPRGRGGRRKRRSA